MHTAQAKVKKSKANFYRKLRHLPLAISPSITESLIFEMMTPVVCVMGSEVYGVTLHLILPNITCTSCFLSQLQPYTLMESTLCVLK